MTELPRTLYNSRRIPPSWSLDSSDLELTFIVSEAFVRRFNAAAVACKAADPAAPDTDVVDSALQQLCACRVLFYDNTVPRVFVEHGTGRTSMQPLAAPRTRLALDLRARKLRMFVARTFPVSSNFGGKPFKLALMVGDDVIGTPAMFFNSKQAKPDVCRKNIKPPVLEEPTAANVAVARVLQSVLPAVDVSVPSCMLFASEHAVEAPPSTVAARRRGKSASSAAAAGKAKATRSKAKTAPLSLKRNSPMPSLVVPAAPAAAAATVAGAGVASLAMSLPVAVAPAVGATDAASKRMCMRSSSPLLTVAAAEPCATPTTLLMPCAVASPTASPTLLPQQPRQPLDALDSTDFQLFDDDFSVDTAGSSASTATTSGADSFLFDGADVAHSIGMMSCFGGAGVGAGAGAGIGPQAVLPVQVPMSRPTQQV